MTDRASTIDLERDVRDAAAGSTEAFTRLVQATQDMVSGIALAIVGDVEASRDIAQETYLAVWNKLSTLANPASFLPWLRAITRNRARTVRAARVRQDDRLVASHEFDHLPHEGRTPPEVLAQREQRELLQQVLSALPDEAREVLILYYREGRSTRQVAQLLDLSDAAVRQRLARARQKVRAEWESQLGEVIDATRPDATFALGVLTMISSASPAWGIAATGKAATKWAGGWWGIGTLWALLVGTVLPALVATASIAWGMRAELRRADSEAERRGLRRIRNLAVIFAIAASLSFTLSALYEVRETMVATYFAFLGGIGLLYLVWLPRVTRSREARERREDPGRAVEQRRIRRMRWIGFIAGAAGGGAGLLIGLGLL